MTLKGTYNAGTVYSTGDIVRYTDGMFYHLVTPATSGTPPTDTRYWNRLDQTQAGAAQMAMDMVSGGAVTPDDVANALTVMEAGKVLDARQGRALKSLIDDLTERVTALEPETPDEGGEG